MFSIINRYKFCVNKQDFKINNKLQIEQGLIFCTKTLKINKVKKLVLEFLFNVTGF